MADRTPLQPSPEPTPIVVQAKIPCIPSGSTILDLALGGGWAEARVFNIVGDKSSGKTGTAIECFANFNRIHSDGRMRYAEAESAFADDYAKTLGFPDSVERPKDLISTVQEWEADLVAFAEKGGPSIYILDSLDALSDSAEMARKEDAATYGADKAKEISKLFRKRIDMLGEKNCTLGIISQVRENIGVTWGDGLTRSGGKALDFYCSQIVWLKETGKIDRSVREQKRIVGVYVTAKCKKNKVSLPFREADYELIFGYGMDDEASMIDWLYAVKRLTKEEAATWKKSVVDARNKGDRATVQIATTYLVDRCRVEWQAIEEHLAPKMSKY